MMKGMILLAMVDLCFVFGGCISGHRSPPLDSPLKVVVGPVILESPLNKSTDIHSFAVAPSPDFEPMIMVQLVDELQIKAQRFLTEELTRKSELIVVPFEETRRMLADLVPAGTVLTPAQLQTLAAQSGADIVLAGLIHDYGRVRWQYWVTGLAVHATTELLLVGLASGWNPAVVVPFFFLDVATDLPIWYGGAYVFGWAFRPVRVGLEAIQMKDCRGVVWRGEELAIHVPGKRLAEYPPEEQPKKETQLEANLKRVMSDFAETLAPKLALQPCQTDGTPAKISTFSIWSFLDLLY
jgi:hypothetical protein